MNTPVKTLCGTYGVCRDTGCVDCPRNDKPRTTLVAGVNWPSDTPAVTAPRGKRVPKEKPLDTTLDYFKEARDFIAPRVKDKGTSQLVRLYRDAAGVIIGSEEVELLPQAYIAGVNPYSGTPAKIFNAGFRAAERLYSIGERKKRTA
jgi:hypothetical protein